MEDKATIDIINSRLQAIENNLTKSIALIKDCNSTLYALHQQNADFRNKQVWDKNEIHREQLNVSNYSWKLRVEEKNEEIRKLESKISNQAETIKKLRKTKLVLENKEYWEPQEPNELK